LGNRRKVAVIGLDSVPPELIFTKLLSKLPNIKKLYSRGVHGDLTTCDPPITIPAWMVMMTGKNPGRLGIYGFRHRRGNSYSDGYIVNSMSVKERTVWEVLAAHGLKSVVMAVPPSYPPKSVQGVESVSCFLTPNPEREFTSPPELKAEVMAASGGKYIFDVTFRTENRETLKQELFEMTKKRFDVAEHLARTRDWDFFMMHEIGFDRLHHAFWKFFDPSHPKYVPGSPFEHIDEEYYTMVDERIGRMLEIFGDECLTYVLSDHGSKGMLGAFCVNQWLAEQGYLRFKTKPSRVVDIEKAEVDWERTKAWGWGGYYARIFFNVKGREANGAIRPDELPREKAELTRRIMGIKDNKGRTMKNKVFEPEAAYGVAVGDRPDLMVYFDELNWRSAGTVGHESNYLAENDTGPDDSVHSMNGIFLMADPKVNLGGRELRGARAVDIAPTLIDKFGIPTSELGPGLEGHPLVVGGGGS
jgi:predicted AlkP superfamily phosphohydrolase/phosphomutase